MDAQSEEIQKISRVEWDSFFKKNDVFVPYLD